MLRGIANGLCLVVALFAAPAIANAQNEIFMYGSSPDFQFTGTGTDVIDVVLPGCSGGVFCWSGVAQGMGSVNSSFGTYIFSSASATPFNLVATSGGGFAVNQSSDIQFNFTAPEGTLTGLVQFSSMSPAALVSGSYQSHLMGQLNVTGGTFANAFGSQGSVNMQVALHFPLTALIGTTNSDTGEIDVGGTAVASPPCATTSSNNSNFNGTAIRAGNFIWFNSNFAAKGVQNGTSITFSNQSIVFTANGTNYNLPVPNAVITFSASATCASTFFDTATMTWHTTIPIAGSDEIFASGLAFMVPAPGLPGGINPVDWQGAFSASTPGVSIQWKWGAAAYSSFSTDYNSLGVKAAHTNTCTFNNSDHAGTPENFKSSVVGGARGGGGSNFTGSWSGTLSASLVCP